MGRVSRSVVLPLVVMSMLLSVFAVASFADDLPPGGTFGDDNGNIHEGNVEAIAAGGITKGCNPPANDLYCPSSSVTRGQMAAFLVRALDLPATSTDFFSDDDGTIFEANINRLAAAGVTKGCNPPVNDLFCPDGDVTRGQIAAFLVRAFGYTDDGGGGLFTDTGGSIFAGNIDRLATAGVTAGCNPPDNDRYCPDDPVKRDQMASFLARALGLPPHVPRAPGAWPGCSTQSSIPSSECDALVALYDSTAGYLWTDRTGWLTDPDPCTWYGVACAGGAVTTLALSANGLSGPLPEDVADLPSLTDLGLWNNQLSGPIPSELGSLANLTGLWLDDNQLSGPIPTELGNLANLTGLGLSRNQLSGPIPTELGNLTNLTGLSLQSNQLSGPIPTELGNLTNLTGLTLWSNQLSGSIPTELGSLANLTGLLLGDNELSGSIPTELGNLTNLTNLSIWSNQLSGSIPTELGNLINLTGLWLGDNQLSGSIPTVLENLTSLTKLGLWGNQLSGSIPPALGNLTNLTALWLGDNQLSGSIPPALGNLTNLTDMDIGGNQLSGSIPTELGNLTGLTKLGLWNNQLSGSIPAELGNLTNLTALWLGDNQLSGSVPVALLALNATLVTLTLSGQTECLTASTTELVTWLASLDANWNDGC